MSDDVLKNKVQDLLEKMERVFHTEWRKTKLNLDHEMIEHFVDARGSFLEPEGSNAMIRWASRDELLISYRSLLEEFGASVEATGVVAETAADRSYDDVVKTADHTEEGEGLKQQTAETVAPNPVKPDILTSVTTSHAIPKPRTGISGPGPGNVQWPGPMTAPVAISPASAQGFPNPFATALNNIRPASIEAPDPDLTEAINDPATIRANVSIEKFAHLLKGVNHEVIRNFVLADGTNSGTDKPTIVIYTIENIWMEFAFPYEEGQRILKKYPQRDPELIEFMKSSGHNE